MADPAPNLPAGLLDQILKAGLPTAGNIPFVPKLAKSRRGDVIIEKADVRTGPKKDKRGWVDVHDRIWIRDRGHAGLGDHWDVQIDGGDSYIRVDDLGNEV